VPGTLRVIREGVGMELRRGTFEITMDGNVVARIERGDTAEAPLPPGHHRLQIRDGRYSSRPHDFDSADGEVVNFRCHGAMMWPRYVASIVKPDLALSLRRE
jgi:hypothetical protein